MSITIPARLRGAAYIVLVVVGILAFVGSLLVPDLATSAADRVTQIGAAVTQILSVLSVLGGTLARVHLTPDTSATSSTPETPTAAAPTVVTGNGVTSVYPPAEQ